MFTCRALLTLLLYPFILYTGNVDAANILFFHNGATASHRTSIWPLAEKLADSGHKVTYIFPISKRLGSHPKIEEIKPSKMIQVVDSVVGDFDINYRLNNTVNDWLRGYFLKSVSFCEAFYDSPETIEWLARPDLHFDLIMIDGGWGQCSYGLVHKFKAKHILFNPVFRHFLWEPFGIVPESSSVPELMFHPKPSEMTLWSRTLTTIAPFIWRSSFLGNLHSMEAIVREKLQLDDMPSFEEIEREASLVFHNTYFVEDYPLSLPPLFVSYSGLLCSEKERKSRKPLPTKLESFLSNEETIGFIYVSFGSSVLVGAMPETLRNEFFNAFAAFPNLRFLWRWTGPVPENTPKNVLLQQWFPQQDVLAHPKIKAFVTQVGRPSTQEALCYGVPLIAFPIFADQDYNADRLENIGASISIEITTLTSQILEDAIEEIVKNDKYKNKMTELSAMFRDRPMDPLENAFYWVEYVLRHNTSLLKPMGMQQTWWQRRLLDVYALIFVMSLAALTVAGLLILLIVKCTMRMMGCADLKEDKRKVD